MWNRRVEAQRRKERNEALLYFTIEVYKDDDFQHHVGPDLYSPDAQPWAFKVLKAMSMEDFRLQLSTSLVCDSFPTTLMHNVNLSSTEFVLVCFYPYGHALLHTVYIHACVSSETSVI